MESNSADSWLWKNIVNVKDVVVNGACKRIGCGSTVDVWEDPWIPSLEGYKPFPLDSLSKQMVFFVRDLFSTSGGWDAVKLRAVFDY